VELKELKTSKGERRKKSGKNAKWASANLYSTVGPTDQIAGTYPFPWPWLAELQIEEALACIHTISSGLLKSISCGALCIVV